MTGDAGPGLGGGNDGLGAASGDAGVEAVRVIALVGQDVVGLEAVDQVFGAADVALLAGADQQPQRIAQAIGGGMDLGAQAAAGTAQALGMRPPFSRRAPAACWWARTMVESTISHSMSGSALKAWKITENTPRSIQS